MCDNEDDGREDDHVGSEHEQRRVPDVAQQTEMFRSPPQRGQDEPRRHHHHRDRCDIDTEQINLDEFHGFTPMSKYSGCLVSPSETTRMLPRPCKAAVSVVPRPANAPSRRFRRAMAM